MTEKENEHHELEHHAAPLGNLMDSKTSHLDDALNKKLEDAFHKHTSQFIFQDIAKIALESDPIDLAYAVTRLPAEGRVVVYENLPDFQAKIIFMIQTGRYTRSVIFKQIRDQEIKQLLEATPADEGVWFLDDMSDRRMRRVLDLLDPKKKQDIKELLKHERNSAGRLMTNEFFAFHMNTTIGEVAAAIRDNPGIELTRRIFVLSEEEQLAGYVPARTLIVNPDNLTLRQIMQPVQHTVTADDSRDEVVDLVERYQISVLPVVDEDNTLLGIVTYEDVVEAMEDIADETIASIAGTAEDVSEHEPTLKRVLYRAPWLIVTICAGMVSAMVMAHFYDRIWFTFIPFFVPLITGMSGNVGIVCSTVLVRSMATGELSSGSKWDAIGKELCIGLLIGTLFGLTCGLFVYFLSTIGVTPVIVNDYILGATVGFGIFGACMTASLLGTFSPFFFARFRIDPAVAAGPIVTAFNDVLSTLMFFVIARLVYIFFNL